MNHMYIKNLDPDTGGPGLIILSLKPGYDNEHYLRFSASVWRMASPLMREKGDVEDFEALERTFQDFLAGKLKT